MIEQLLHAQSIEALGWTLLHCLWQGALFAILLALVLIVMRRYSAQARYTVSVGLLSVFLLTVATTFWLQLQSANTKLELAMQLNDANIGALYMTDNIAGASLSSANDGFSLTVENELSATEKISWLSVFRDYYARHLPLLVTIWLLGVLILQLRFLGQLAFVQRLKHHGTQLFPQRWKHQIEELEAKLRIRKKVQYLTSTRIESPIVIGWLKPVVLLPRQVLKRLSEKEVYAILAHELAHIRREDFVVNMLQTLLTNVFFFHPGIWWMSSRVDEEREYCCDDLAVAATGQAVPYANTLITISELQLALQSSSAQLALSFSGKRNKRQRGGFSDRIRRLFVENNGAHSFREGFATACILLAALFFGVGATGHTGQSYISQDVHKPTSTENRIDIASSTADDNLAFTTGNTIGRINGLISNITQPPEMPESPATPVQSTIGKLPIASPAAPVQALAQADARIDALNMACAEGDFTFVKDLLNTGIDINGIGSQGFTPLMTATNEDEVIIVAYLISQGADVNQVANGWTALLEAADEGATASMGLLLKAGADMNIHSPDGRSPLTMAASEGKLACLKMLIEYGADINGTGEGMPPLHAAAEENRREIIEYLISQNVNVNKRDAQGRTALMLAEVEGNRSVARRLREVGIDNSKRDSFGDGDYDKTNQDFEAQDDGEFDKGVEAREGQRFDSRHDIHRATTDGLIEKVSAMVENGVDVDLRDEKGRTALHLATSLHYNLDIPVLLKLGADINAQDNYGRTPLMYAAHHGHVDLVAFLVSRGADVNIQDVDGHTAYDLADDDGDSDLAQFLGLITKKNKTDDEELRSTKRANRILQKAVDKKVRKQEEQVQKEIRKQEEQIQKEIQRQQEQSFQSDEAFHIAKDGHHLHQFNIHNEIPELLEAAREGSVPRCRRLLESGVDVNVMDDTGQTALMRAAGAGHLSVTRFLLANGADPNMRSVSGVTALHYSALERHERIAQLLLRNGAKVDPVMRFSSTDGKTSKELIAWEYKGATPLLIAIEGANPGMVSILMTAGANPDHMLTKIEYQLKKGNKSYLDLSEVIGLDEEFKQNAEVRSSVDNWSPYKQAQLMNQREILNLLTK